MELLWSDLFDRPGRLAVELNKVGTTSRFLVLDLRDAARDNSTLQTELDRVGPAGWLLLALEWFGDLGNPQPTNRTLWSGSFRTPDWTVPRFPPLEDDEAAPSATQPNLTRPLPPLPADVNLFLFSSIQKGVRKFDAGASINRVHDETVFTLHDASRLHWMLERGFFRLKAGKLLPPGWHVARVGKRYALRFLDEASWKWIDPAGTSRTPG
jgi:hypothetical protein